MGAIQAPIRPLNLSTDSVTTHPDGTTQPVSLGALPPGTNVIGHIIVDSAGNVAITALPSIPAGTNVIGHVIVDSGAVTVSGTVAATQSGAWTADVSDRAARLLGHVMVDNASLAVTGTFWQATQPVSAHADRRGEPCRQRP